MKNKEILIAPIAGITSSPFRQIVRKFSNCLQYTEMVSINGLYYKDSKTIELLQFDKKEKPLGVQLFGGDYKLFSYAAKYLDDNYDFDIIDINFGCSVKKVIKNGYGSYLLKDYKKILKIIEEIKKVTNKPLSIKIRKGFSEKEILGNDFYKEISNFNLNHITVHGRLAKQLYLGKADWDYFNKIDKFNNKIIGNGDINDFETAKDRLINYNVDGIMLARGIFGSPWFINEIENKMNMTDNNIYLKYKDKNIDILKELIFEHLELSMKILGEHVTLNTMKKNICWYLKGYKNSSFIRAKINSCSSYNEMVKIVESL